MLQKQHGGRKPAKDPLSRRERQIMDILYQRGRAAAAEIHEAIPDRPTYSAIRAKLRILEEKGHIRHEADGARYIFAPVVTRDRAKRPALKHLVDTFFEGSVEQAVMALLDLPSTRIASEELDRLSQLIEKAKEESSAHD